MRLEMEGSRVRARVKGTQHPWYAVGVDWSEVGERVLHTFCECPRFAGGNACKHVWATLLALTENGPDDPPPGRDRLSVRRDHPSSWTDLGVAVAAQPVASKGPDRSRSGRRRPKGRAGRPREARDSWRSQLAFIREETNRLSSPFTPALPSLDRLRFLVNKTESLGTDGLVLDIFENTSKPKDRSASLRPASVDPGVLQELLLPAGESADCQERLPLVSALSTDGSSGGNRRRRDRARPEGVRRLRLPRQLYHRVLPHLCTQGALGWWEGRGGGKTQSIAWDPDPPWRLALRLENGSRQGARLRGALEREGETVALGKVQLIMPIEGEDSQDAAPGAALVLFAETLGRCELEAERDLPWIELLREAGEIAIPKEDVEEALTSILELSELPRIETPAELELSREASSPQPRLVLESDASSVLPDPPLLAQLSFLYGELEVGAGDQRGAIVDWDEGVFLRRDMERENQALVRLLEVGLQPEASGHGEGLELPRRELPDVAERLLAEDWIVEVRGRSLRPPSPPALRVESGIDWFELSGSTDFAGDRVELNKILEAISRGDRFVELSDGTQGVLPAAWMETWGSLAELAHESSEKGLRFRPSQTLLVDALLTQMPAPDVDSAFSDLLEQLRSFERIKPKKEPRGFKGTLREYQRHGLGWLGFLRDFGLGGVLADDMGLGKTVQVLALLRANRTPSKTTGLASLVVAPRSLVYNWIDEAARFTPTLSVIEYGGPDREALRDELGKHDIVVTTYGTLRRDVGFLSTVEFDTVVLDEAQAIKNRESQVAKASRLLDARHRLALTGTPIENHLGELGSLFEFLNPGFLGRLPMLDVLASGRAASKQELALVASGMRPFILRRTKAEVLADLPPKTEQVLLCDLRPRQRELYDKLRAAYQASLLDEVEAKGVAGSAIQVLEALLRLRQVACHPGLVEEDWEDAGSAKLEALFEQVSEVLEEGHKVLVFSQFTSLLAYVRKHLDEEGIEYAYLDGQTRNRGEVVERFQTDPSCNLFVMSLKAGGVGLNLTAAGYVFLLDPWWNPAVEAQAIDRAHRIGQTQPVFSYRLIVRDTVEEKILELQRSKSQLADSILEGGGQTLGDLTADDLRMLLS